MRTLLISIFFLVLTFSCSKTDSNVDSSSTILIKSWTNPSEPTNWDFIYNGTKIVKWTYSGSSNIYITLTYSGNLITKMESFTPNNVLGGYMEFSYVNNKLSQRKNYLYGALTYKDDFINNSDGSIQMNRTNYSSSSGSTYSENYFFDSVGNITRKTSSNGYSYIYTYDNKSNPYKNVSGLYGIYFTECAFSPNNVLSRTDYQGSTKTYSISTIYQYNDLSYPISGSVSYNGKAPHVENYYY